MYNTLADMTSDTWKSKGDKVGGEILRNCLFTRTRQISRVLTTVYDQALRPFGINAPQFTLLVLVHELGPISRADLGRRNHHDRSTLTRNLQPLLAQGWLAEGTPEQDGRTRPLSVTAQGKTLLRRAAPAWSTAQAEARALMGKAGADAIMDIASELPKRSRH
ncbi:DNA-binding transcriptional regulator, MarR family [Cupriavidus sp. YR651]|uniref:MarR family winged helix-turn-helix transcriptional regulator n=1 Tax=Cupriavidus sp. YR651 TaxID=1855315 RepID=UPI00088C62EB|nr:MarR family transcriptional regulator [Cupriavidus sp. YR651]SDD52244.1 DNA-binding transcriptional regulator, MarR family [Cupriavidus sp. YR651]